MLNFRNITISVNLETLKKFDDMRDIKPRSSYINQLMEREIEKENKVNKEEV